MKLLEQTAKYLAEKLTAVSRKITAHAENRGNPHGVTKAQVGLGNSDNTSDADKPLSAAQMEALGTMNGTISGHVAEASIHKTSSEIRADITDADIPATLARIVDLDSRIVTHNQNPEAHADIREQIGKQIAEHTGRTDNPHSVTKVQVGLGKADNTSDADKPVSSATAAEIAAVRTETASGLNTKVDKQDGYGLSSNDYTAAEKKKLGQVGEYVRKCTFKKNTSSTHHYLRCETWDPAVGGENEILCEVPRVNETADGFCTPGMKTVIDGLSHGSGTLTAQGTPSALWNIGTPGGPSLKASGGQMEVRNAGDTAYADLSVRDLSVKGNLAVEGESFIVNTQTVEVADNTILLNKGEVGAGVTKGIAGLEIDRGSEEKYKIIFDESDDRVKVGKGDDLWPVMLRDKDADLTAGSTLIWDAAAKRAISGKNIDAELSAYALKTDLDPLQTKTGDTRDNTATFTEASATENIGSGETHTVIFGKIRKWFSSLGTLAFRNTVSIPEVDNLQTTLNGKEPAFAKNTAFNRNFGTAAGTVCGGSDPRLSDARRASGGNADTVDGYHVRLDKTWSGIINRLALVDENGCLEIGKYIDFHDVDSDIDFDIRLKATPGRLDCSGVFSAYNLLLSGKQVATTDQIPVTLPANGGNADTLDNRHADEFVQKTGDQKIEGNLTLNTQSASFISLNRNGVNKGYMGLGASASTDILISNYVGGSSINVSDNGKNYSNGKEIATLDNIPASLPANGGNADTVDGKHADDFIQNSGTVDAPVIQLKNGGNQLSILGANDNVDGPDYVEFKLGTSGAGITGTPMNELYLSAQSREHIYTGGQRLCTKVFVSEIEPIEDNMGFSDGDIWVQP